MRQLLLICLLSLLSACSSNKPYIEYENSAMSDKLKISDVRSRTQYDVLQLGVDVTNKTSKEVQFQYKFKFFDKDGFEVMPESRPWVRKILSAKETVNIQVTAPNATVVGGKIYIKE